MYFRYYRTLTYGGESNDACLVVFVLGHQVGGQTAEARQQHVAQQAAPDTDFDDYENADAYGNGLHTAGYCAIYVDIAT